VGIKTCASGADLSIPAPFLMARLHPIARLRPIAPLLAGAAPGGGKASAAYISPGERFRSLLDGGGIEVDNRVMTDIATNNVLTLQANFAMTTEAAVQVYALAALTMHSKTRGSAARGGVILDGPLYVAGTQAALFFYAFQDGVPKVFKVTDPSKGAAECMLYEDIGAGAAAAHPRAFLVPVTYLPLERGSHHEVRLAPGKSEYTALIGGILMPF
jgi:hypothetical protein